MPFSRSAAPRQHSPVIPLRLPTTPLHSLYTNYCLHFIPTLPHQHHARRISTRFLFPSSFMSLAVPLPFPPPPCPSPPLLVLSFNSSISLITLIILPSSFLEPELHLGSIS
ncbi:hypothetical protein E2C01_032394 [Portunus trituberculatus]|uniref:Uncharacterized protein n=1 Tax=Portunus trituberculatus TaxID=210409 RepID=A0A5B7F0T8_PORTR|nr:hypothetical protein [Portunus trituberculatus]